MSADDNVPKTKIVGAVAQAIKLLQVIGDSDRPQGVSALAREAKVNPSTAFNILRTLAVHHLVAFDELSKTYTLSHGLYGLSKGVLGQRITDMIKPEMQRVASKTASLIGLWQVSGDRVILSDRAVANMPMRLDMELGQRLPLVLGSVGRAVAASMKLSDAELTARFKRLRWNGTISAQQYVADVRDGERLGYSVDRETLYPGVVSVGAVIRNAEGVPIYGLTGSNLSNNMSEAKIAEIGQELAAITKLFSN